MAKSPKERKADQRKRDRAKGIIHASVKVKIEVFGSIKKISKEKNKTIDEVVGELLDQSLEQEEAVQSGDTPLGGTPPEEKVNEDPTSESNQP